MTELIAKPVLKNKIWIVESEGNQIGTIFAVENGGYVYVRNDNREKFNTIKLLSKTYNVKFDKLNKKKIKIESSNTIYSFPIEGKAYNVMWDLKHKLPVYTKTSKSKSYFCAGHYVVYFNEEWTEMFCPKLITVNRYKFFGPFKTQDQAQDQLEKLKNGV
jgi:hypothetical protein